MNLKTNMKTGIILLAALLLVIVVSGCSSKDNNGSGGYGTGIDGNAVAGNSGMLFKVYKSEGCGCCSGYIKYLQKVEGFDNVEIVGVADVAPTKDEQGVPQSLRSCHTVVVGDYFIEGHVPGEAIDKLMSEKPDIKGIAIAGMPSGSPGMPGGKTGDFVVYAVHKDGSIDEFMRV